MPTADVGETLGEIIPNGPRPISPEDSNIVRISGRESLNSFIHFVVDNILPVGPEIPSTFLIYMEPPVYLCRC